MVINHYQSQYKLFISDAAVLPEYTEKPVYRPVLAIPIPIPTFLKIKYRYRYRHFRFSNTGFLRYFPVSVSVFRCFYESYRDAFFGRPKVGEQNLKKLMNSYVRKWFKFSDRTFLTLSIYSKFLIFAPNYHQPKLVLFFPKVL